MKPFIAALGFAFIVWLIAEQQSPTTALVFVGAMLGFCWGSLETGMSRISERVQTLWEKTR